MAFERQLEAAKDISRMMLLEIIEEDETFEARVSDMAHYILADLYKKNFSERDVNNALSVFRAAARI